jgi:type IV secretion system protein VirB2
MFNNVSAYQVLRSYTPFLLLLCAVMVLLLMPDIAHATTENNTQNLPFEEPLQKLKNSLTGPVAFGISLVGIVAAGAVLIFGGEMSGFLRTLVFLVLVIALIVNAGGLIKIMSGDGAMIAAQVEHSLRMLRGVA